MALNEIKKGGMTFAEVGSLRRPVIHLDIDVGVIVAVPGGIILVIPEAL